MTAFLLLLSCDYDIDELSFREVVIPEPEYPVLNLDFSDSVVIIYDDCLMNYEVKLETQEYLGSEVYLDGKLLLQNEEMYGSFLANPIDGTHKLEMFIYTNSASGSIREQLGGEKMEFSKTWTLIKQKPEYERLKFTSTGLMDGSMQLHWEAYTGYRFQYYEIKTNNPFDSYKIEDVNISRFSDPHFVGGAVEYYLQYVTEDNDVIPCDTFRVSILNELKYEVNDDFSLTFKWRKCPVVDNFESYTLVSSTNGASLNMVITAPEDTSVNIAWGLYPNNDFYLKIKSVNSGSSRSEYDLTREVQVGTPISLYSGVTHAHQPPYRVYSDMEVYEPMTGNIIPRSISYKSDHIAVNPDQSLIVSGKHWSGVGQTYLWKELTLLPVNYLQDTYARMSLANIGIGLFEVKDSLILYDFEAGTARRLLFPMDHRKFEISPSGEFILCQNWSNDILVYRLVDSEPVYQGQVQDEGILQTRVEIPYFFVPGSADNEFLLLADGKLWQYSCDQMQMLRSVETPVDAIVDIDPQTSTVLCVKDKTKYYIYALSDFSLIEEVDVFLWFESRQNIHKSRVAYSCGQIFMKRTYNYGYCFDVLDPEKDY